MKEKLHSCPMENGGKVLSVEYCLENTKENRKVKAAQRRRGVQQEINGLDEFVSQYYTELKYRSAIHRTEREML